jgi:cytochrome P450
MSDTDFDHWREHFSFLDDGLTGGRWVDVVNRLRDECPVAYSDAHEDGFHILTRYEDIVFAHNNPDMYSSCPVTMPTAGLARPWIPIESDPPLHKKYRAILNDLLSNRTQQSKEPTYREIASGILDRLVPQGGCDLFKDFCLPFPTHVIMDAFEIPEGDRAHMAEQMLLFIHRPGAMEDAEKTQRIVMAAAIELNTYLAELIDQRKGGDGDDIISVLCRGTIDGTPLTDKEIIDYSMLVIPAGFETTSFTMGFVFRFLGENPDVRRTLVEDPSRIPAAVEEVMRLETPTRALARTVMVDHEVQGTQLRRGDRVLLLWAAADRDPDVFDRPNEFVLDRKPNRHLGFGYGTHLCSGIHMARVELKVAVEEVLKQIPDYEISDPAAVREVVGMTWSLSSLPVTWNAGAA